jgi:signal peptidase I
MQTSSLGSKVAVGSAIAVLLVSMVALLVLKAFFISYYVVPQNGMYPGLPAGSMFFALQHPYAAPARVKRADIVVFTRGTDAGRYVYIWRVVGLPGDTIEAVGERLAINGQPVARERLREEQGLGIFRERAGDVTYEVAISQSPRDPPPPTSLTVPPDQFFVMGDNRFNAVDSRYFGPIPFDAIIGRKL